MPIEVMPQHSLKSRRRWITYFSAGPNLARSGATHEVSLVRVSLMQDALPSKERAMSAEIPMQYFRLPSGEWRDGSVLATDLPRLQQSAYHFVPRCSG